MRTVRTSLVPRVVSLVVSAWGLVACGDPLREERIAALGPEVRGVPEGPMHRAGQPCLTCHDGKDDAVREFSVAGTIYAFPIGEEVAVDATVELRDAAGKTYRVATNCAGNFFVEPADFAPTFPVWVSLASDDYRIRMDSPMRRDGSCGSCHGSEATRRSVERVHLFGAIRPLKENGCR